MTCAGREQYDLLIGELTATLFAELGCDKRAIDGLVTELKGVAVSPNGGVGVRFQGAGGSCDVIITMQGREVLRRTLHL